MKRLRTILVVMLFGLVACPAPPPKPAINLPEVPSGDLVRALEQRRRDFSGLKALAGVDLLRKGRRRAFDTVGVVLQAQRKLKLEAYGPLGQSLMVLVWDGNQALYRSAGENKVQRAGPFTLERLLGVAELNDFCAALAGNIPELAPPVDAQAFCGPDGGCLVELRKDDTARRVWVSLPPSGDARGLKITAYELFRSDALVFRAKFQQIETLSRYALPMRILFENPANNVLLTVEYADVDLNVPVDDSLFTLSPEETGSDE